MVAKLITFYHKNERDWRHFLKIDIVMGPQKLGLILESKVVQKLSLEKNVLTKNGLLNWYS